MTVCGQKAAPPDLHQVGVLLRAASQPQPLQQLLLSPLQQLVEDVEVAFPGVLVHHAGFLNQVAQDVPTDRSALERAEPKRESSGATGGKGTKQARPPPSRGPPWHPALQGEGAGEAHFSTPWGGNS